MRYQGKQQLLMSNFLSAADKEAKTNGRFCLSPTISLPLFVFFSWACSKPGRQTSKKKI